MKVITRQLTAKLSPNHRLRHIHEVNPQDFSELYLVLKDALQLIIYDITSTSKHAPDTIISVNDHINRTGKNPLMGHQKELGIDFVDITNIYKSGKNGVNTDCCGKKLNTKYPYPSQYLCNISILARAMDIKTISALLVNIP